MSQSLRGNGHPGKTIPSRGWGPTLLGLALPPPHGTEALEGAATPLRGKTVILAGCWVWLRRSVRGPFSFTALLDSPLPGPHRPFRSTPYPVSQCPREQASGGAGVVTKRWILFASFHLSFPNTAEGLSLPHFTAEETGRDRE